IIVKNDGFLNIKGGTIRIDVSDDEYDKILNGIKDDKQLNITLISGNYTGEFDKSEFIFPSDKEDDCNEINSDIEYNDKSVNALFLLDKSKCGVLKWWMILLIVIGAVAIVSVVCVIIFKKRIVKVFK